MAVDRCVPIGRIGAVFVLVHSGRWIRVCLRSPARHCRSRSVVSVVSLLLCLAGCRDDSGSGAVAGAGGGATLATSPDTVVSTSTVTAEDVAWVAWAQLQLPAPRMAMHPTGDQVVGVPVWLWVQSWSRMWATASIGGVSVTAIARPVSVAWAMGDGSTVVCQGPGTPFRGMRDPMDRSPDCGYLYPWSSADQPGLVFELRVTVRWSVWWVDGAIVHPLPDLTTSGTGRLRVVEPRVRVRPSRRAPRCRSSKGAVR